MKSQQLLQICLVTSSSNLFNDRHLDNVISALYARRSASASGRHQRHRRGPCAQSTPYHPYTPTPRRRLVGEPSNCRSIQRLLRPFSWEDMGLERRLSRAAPNAPVSGSGSGSASVAAVVNASSTDWKASDPAPPAAYPTQSDAGQENEAKENGPRMTDAPSKSMAPPPPPPPDTTETFETRSTRSTSSASRTANRLSLTLPIAPPNSIPSRPTPTSSIPPTPVDATAYNSLFDSEDITAAIAAQERRVLELREELARAELELKDLRSQWIRSRACVMRPSSKTVEPPRSLAPATTLQGVPGESPGPKRISELERRKTILLAQSQGTPRQHKRTVIRGGHTRTLSLLSPTKSVIDMPAYEDRDPLRSPDSVSSRSSSTAGNTLNKRATWAPHQTQQQVGVKQLANDLKQGLLTFVEDLRQATVGEESVSGTTHRTLDMGARPAQGDVDQDTIRASTANRGRIPFSPEPDSQPGTPSDTLSRPSTSGSNDRFQHRRTTSRPEPRTKKRFSWTPLTFESVDDDDWSNWDSPSVKTSRWSGSTANGEAIPVIPERADENESTLKAKRSRNDLQSSSPPKTPSKLEELPQAILHRFTPSKIRTTASNFIKDWERSLSPAHPSSSETDSPPGLGYTP
ncbi:hypothetical protein F5Y17DRAFT_435586 [Xylariaceae sp. FL0594]|nr:hypothetical protein F5Y17DRAFT_435586 [Xylariaceae sp. FL0594]